MEKHQRQCLQRLDGTKPIEAKLTMLSIDPEVHFLMMPIPKSSRPSPYDKDPKDKTGKGKGKRARKAKDQGVHQRDAIRKLTKINQYVLVIIVDFAS